jgi:hypothetical protein
MPGLENYIPVKQRIHDMREQHADWGVTTELGLVADYWHAKTTITDETGRVISTGSAVEKNTKPFDAEKAETSAVGRALVFAGWTDSLELSQEEVERSQTVRTQTKPKAKPDPVVVAKNRLVELMGVEAAAEFWRLHQSMTPSEIVELATGEKEEQ